jgi:2-polyprenyl-3-methyl-5-hydroxy-6-metoxy-1,4-benzoquinol methylase
MSIRLVNPVNQEPLLANNEGLIQGNTVLYPFKNGAYRIVEDNNYTENFGYQWNKFAQTQVDKVSHLDISRVRFFAETNWDKEDLSGKNILEVGSGAGRFSQIILDYTKGNLYSVDYSNAVEANYKNNGPNDRLHLFQASIYDMPFVTNQFDKVICLGVLQHTPDVEKSVKILLSMAKPGAEVVVDFYPIKGWWSKIHAKYLLRPFTKKMSNEKLFGKIERNIDWMIKTSRFFTKIGLGVMNRFIPICDIDGTLPQNLPYEQLRELCVLDTFDMFSPQYDQPQRISTVVKWFEENGMENVWGGYITFQNNHAAVVRGVKK